MPELENPSSPTASRLARDLAAARQRIHDLEARLAHESAAETDALAASGERLRLLLGNLQELILVVDPDRRITDVAGNCMGLIGYAARELVGPDIDLDVLQLFSEGDRQAVRNQFAEAGLRPQGRTPGNSWRC